MQEANGDSSVSTLDHVGVTAKENIARDTVMYISLYRGLHSLFKGQLTGSLLCASNRYYLALFTINLCQCRKEMVFQECQRLLTASGLLKKMKRLNSRRN
jgi:hypothetical protein